MAFTTEQIARWWNILCGWQWPDDLPGKPEGFDAWCNFFPLGDGRRLTEANRYNVVDPLMRLLEAMIGAKECLRWHHLHNLQRTDEEFEEWWAENHGQALVTQALAIFLPPGEDSSA
jgi:hypothetical protein